MNSECQRIHGAADAYDYEHENTEINETAMLAKRIIPCLDLNKGRVVKGVNFVNLIDAGDPVEAAAAYDRAGADEIVFLDITASSEGARHHD